jgi:acyl-CoA synthetase (NDP forming)
MLYSLSEALDVCNIANLLFEDEEAKDILIHCVAGVVDRYKDKPDAWLIAKKICIASLQDKGYLKPGSLRLTAKGKRAELSHARERNEEDREKYEKYLRYYRRYRRYLAKKRKRKKKK